MGFAFLWVISFMSYVWAPWPIWHGLFHGGLPRFQQIILTVGTLAFSLEFLFARNATGVHAWELEEALDSGKLDTKRYCRLLDQAMWTVFQGEIPLGMGNAFQLQMNI